MRFVQLRQEFKRKHSRGYDDDDDEYEVEQLRTELASLRREHARIQTDHARSLSEAEVRASDAVELRNDTARRHYAAEAEARELREKLEKMQEENDKLRKSVNLLKQQSADQDVKILQLQKTHEQDTEDKLGLNIALDSKQQELELVRIAPTCFQVQELRLSLLPLSRSRDSWEFAEQLVQLQQWPLEQAFAETRRPSRHLFLFVLGLRFRTDRWLQRPGVQPSHSPIPKGQER